jgi:hypothetical protein
MMTMRHRHVLTLRVDRRLLRPIRIAAAPQPMNVWLVEVIERALRRQAQRDPALAAALDGAPPRAGQADASTPAAP